MLFLLTVPALWSGEATLILPDPLVTGVEIAAEVEVKNAGDEITALELPDVPGVTWGKPRRGGTQVTSINGDVTTTISIIVPLTVAQTGAVTIPAFAITLRGGGTLSTAAVTATATATPPATDLVGDIRCEAAFEPDTIVPGQPCELVYRIHLRRGSVNSSGIKPPAESISLGELSQAEGSTYDAQGERWKVVTLRWPLTFSASGTYTASGQQPYQLTTGRDIFSQRTVTRQAPVRPASITVTSLPVEGRPDDFANLIGAVTVVASLDRTRISLGEGVVLDLSVGGRQVDLLRQPSLTLPPGIQAIVKDAVTRDGSAGGTRVFRWDLVPSVPGTFTVPAFSFSYFDPATRSYRRAASEPLALTVIPGRSQDLAIRGGAGAPTDPARPTSAATPANPFPEPWRGAAPARPSPALAWSVFAAALAIGAIAGLASRWRGSRHGADHRGRALARAVAAGDATAIAKALHDLGLAPLDPTRRALRDRLAAAVDEARFGGRPLPSSLTDDARPLEDVT